MGDLEEYWTIDLNELKDSIDKFAEARFRAGIKEVVEWIESIHHPKELWVNEQVVLKDCIIIGEEEFVAKLKEWGITPY